MSYVVNITVELDAENETVAERQFHRLFETLVDEDYVMAIAADKPVPGTVRDSEADV